MEMAEASGIILVNREELDPLKATTYGVGEMILDAVKRGCRDFIIGIGGSATSEGGIGMLQALGYEINDADGQPVKPGLQDMERIASISGEHVSKVLRECHFSIACDVKNPLCGENGAVYVYGPQKGVREDEKPIFDKKMEHFADMTREYLERISGNAGSVGSDEAAESLAAEDAGSDEASEASMAGNAGSGETGEGSMAGDAVSDEASEASMAEDVCRDYRWTEGAGAAGGLGFAFLSYLPNVELKSGIDIVLEAVGLEEEVKDADMVITGEGRLDSQTAMGKVPVGVARLAKRYGAQALAFAGGVTKDAGECNAAGIDAFFPIVRGVTTLDEAIVPENAKENMELSVEQVFRAICTSHFT